MDGSSTVQKQVTFVLTVLFLGVLEACPNEPVLETSGGEVLDFPDAVVVTPSPVPVKQAAAPTPARPPSGEPPLPEKLEPAQTGAGVLPGVPSTAEASKPEPAAIGCGFRTESEPAAPEAPGVPLVAVSQGTGAGSASPAPLQPYDPNGKPGVPPEQGGALPPQPIAPEQLPTGSDLPPSLAAAPSAPTPPPVPVPTLIPTDRAHPLPLMPVPPPQMAGGRPKLFVQLDLLPDFMLKQEAIVKGKYVTLSGSLRGDACRQKKIRLDVLEYRGGRPEIVTVVTVSDIGAYQIHVPTSDHSLWITAFCDVDSDNFFKEGSDLMGAYSRNPVVPTSSRSGLDIDLGLERPSKEGGMPPENQ